MKITTSDRRAAQIGRKTTPSHVVRQEEQPRAEGLIDDYALARIDYRVGRLARAFRLSEEDADDLRQEMAAELLKANGRYDPTRSRRNTYVTRTLDRYYRHVARRLRNRQRHEAMKPTPMSAMKNFRPVVNDPGSGELSEQERTELRIDQTGILDSMPARLRRFFVAMKVYLPREAADFLGVHPSTVYRAIAEIRPYFVGAGYGGVA